MYDIYLYLRPGLKSRQHFTLPRQDYHLVTTAGNYRRRDCKCVQSHLFFFEFKKTLWDYYYGFRFRDKIMGKNNILTKTVVKKGRHYSNSYQLNAQK
jgi:hypothetical protein